MTSDQKQNIGHTQRKKSSDLLCIDMNRIHDIFSRIEKAIDSFNEKDKEFNPSSHVLKQDCSPLFSPGSGSERKSLISEESREKESIESLDVDYLLMLVEKYNKKLQTKRDNKSEIHIHFHFDSLPDFCVKKNK